VRGGFVPHPEPPHYTPAPASALEWRAVDIPKHGTARDNVKRVYRVMKMHGLLLERWVRIAFTLDCCDREAISWVATTDSINSSDIRDLMIESVERRFGLID
jgi:putative transposase